MADKNPASHGAASALAGAEARAGTLISFSAEERSGWIEGDDNELYFFAAADVVSDEEIPVGHAVRFVGADGLATEIRPAVSAQPAATAPDDSQVDVEEPPAQSASQPAPAAVADPAAADPQAAASSGAEDEGDKSRHTTHPASGSPPRPATESAPPAVSAADVPQVAAASEPARTLRGTLVSHDSHEQGGWIQGEDSVLYRFTNEDVTRGTKLFIGKGVLFTARGKIASQVVSIEDADDPAAVPVAVPVATEAKRRRADLPTPRADSRARGRAARRLGYAALVILALAGGAYLWSQRDTSVSDQLASKGQDDGTTPWQLGEADADAVFSGRLEAGSDEVAVMEPPTGAAADPAETSRASEPADMTGSKTEPVPMPEADQGADAATPAPSAAADTPAPSSADESEEPPLQVAQVPTPEPLAAETRRPLPPPEPRNPPPAVVVAPAPAPPSAPSPPKPAPSRTTSQGELTQWWPEPAVGVLNLRFAGHLSERPAIVLAFDGIFSATQNFAPHIVVSDASGRAVSGDWEVGPNATTLILPVTPGRYHVSLGAGLRDTRGTSLGRAMGGTVRVR